MKPPAKTHTRGIHAALGKNVGHFRTTWIILAVLTLTVVLRWESRAQPRYWTPQNPPAAEYRFRLKIGLDGLEGRGTIRLTNSTHRPLTVLALEGPSSTPLPEVTVDGQPLRLRNPHPQASEGVSGPVLYQAACDDPVWRSDPGYAMRHDQFKLRIDRAWIQQRMQQPFKWPTQVKPNPPSSIQSTQPERKTK